MRPVTRHGSGLLEQDQREGDAVCNEVEVPHQEIEHVCSGPERRGTGAEGRGNSHNSELSCSPIGHDSENEA